MFRSARVKLTLFYLAIFFVFSLLLTASVRVLAEHEYMNSNDAQRGKVRQLILHLLDDSRLHPDRDFIAWQDAQELRVRARLNADLALINIAAIAIGGGLSYWFAGRTLKPIEEAHEAQARFASDASHELRTPLTNMKLENEVFLRQKQFDEAEARELIKSNLEEVQRLEGLSSNLLALTQYGQTALTKQAIAVKQLIEAAVESAHKKAASRQVQLKTHYHHGVIRGHQESLVQLLDILLDNALKYGPRGSIVTIGGRLQDSSYLLWIQDEGPGIDEADLPHIFDRLYRGDKARSSSVSGYGLGLSLARAIAKANNAQLTAHNAPKGGAVFMLLLPLEK